MSAIDPDDWLGALGRLRLRGEACVLVTLAAAEGSSPREGGAKMLVTPASQFGSIGGGHLELIATERARAMLTARAAAPSLETFALGPRLGQCCGGSVTLLFEAFLPATFDIALFGAGHVGKAVIHALDGLPAAIRWVDPRAEQFPALVPANVEKLTTDRPEDEVADLPAGGFVLVMTHSHDIDYAICEKLARRGDMAFVGLIGSASKWSRFQARMRRRGVAESAIASIRCPIGIQGITGKHPREIAIAASAQLLIEREKHHARLDLPARVDHDP